MYHVVERNGRSMLKDDKFLDDCWFYLVMKIYAVYEAYLEKGYKVIDYSALK